MSVDLQIFKPPSVLILFINQSCCSFIYFSFLKGTVVASLSISHQMPRWLYGNCSSLSVSNGPGHVQTLIKIWLKYPFCLLDGAKPMLCAGPSIMFALCVLKSLLLVRLIVRHPKPQPHWNLCWRCTAFSCLSVIHLSSYINWWLNASKWKWCLLSFKM